MISQIYVGTYMGENGGEGIYLLELDTGAGQLRKVTAYPALSDDPSFLAVAGDFLYAVTEGMESGKITAFRRDADTGELHFLNQISTQGSAMCHLLYWKDRSILSAANYMSGSLLSVDVEKDGTVGQLRDFIQHSGVGFDSTGRQEGPHVHSTGLSPDGSKLFAADLGLDRVFCYDIGAEGELTAGAESAQIRVPLGEGPRHFTFSDDGRYLYLATEMGSKVFVFTSRDGWNSHEQLQCVSALPGDFRGENTGADIHLSPDGAFLYMSNRGIDCISAFRVDRNTGKLENAGYFSCGGSWPRNFCITRDGRYILIANQFSGNVVLCPRDGETGAVGEKVSEVSIPRAVFVTQV